MSKPDVIHVRWMLLLLLLAVTACSRRTAFDPDSTYSHARNLQKRGELHQALVLADSGLSQFKNLTKSEWYWKFRLLKAEVFLLLTKPLDASALLPDSPTPAPDITEIQARILFDRGWVEYERSHYRESRELLDQALQLAEPNDMGTLVAEIKLRRGAARARQGDSVGGEIDFRDALQLARKSNDTYLETSALGNLAVLRMQAGRYDEAISSFSQVIVLSGKLQSKSFAARNLNNLAYCYIELGQPDKAAPMFDQAQQLAKETGVQTDVQIGLGRMGDWFESQQQYAQAASYYQRALEAARQSHSQYWVAKWLYQAAATSIDVGDLAHAEDYNRQARDLEAQIDNPVERLWPQMNAARIAEARQQFGEAERVYRFVIESAAKLTTVKDPSLYLEARRRLANLLVSIHRDSEADAEFQRASALIDTTRTELQKDEYRITYFSTLLHFYQDYVDFLIAQHREIDALKVAESSRARVLTEKLGGAGASRARATESDYRKLARASKTILLSYWLAPRRSFLWVVTPSKVATFQLPGQPDIEALVKAYAGSIEGLRDPVHEGSETGRKLYQALLAPMRALIPPGSNVAVVPDGPLHSLNFESLPAPGVPSHYWIEDVTISVIPSLDLVYRHPARPLNQANSLLLIGDPVPPDQKGLPILTNATKEVSGIQQQFTGAVVRTGAEAEPQAYAASKPERFSMIHFAAHAEANHQDPLESAIILSPLRDRYKLYAREVVSLPIHADLVTISACRGAGSRTYAGEGLVGFAWAFLQAGARNVVAGLWEVDDRSTAQLMEKMYAELRQGKTPQQALRAAQLALLQSEGPYRKPYYWAPFQVITDTLPY